MQVLQVMLESELILILFADSALANYGHIHKNSKVAVVRGKTATSSPLSLFSLALSICLLIIRRDSLLWPVFSCTSGHGVE